MRVTSKGEHLGRGYLKGLTVGFELMQCDFAKHLSDASDTAKIALAPRLLLLSVPSKV